MAATQGLVSCAGELSPTAEVFGVTLSGHKHLCWMKLGIDRHYLVSHSPYYNTLSIREKFTAINTKMCILYHKWALNSSRLLVQAEDLP